MKPKVILAPHFRRMDEIFDPATLVRLHDLADVQWGKDEPMPPNAFLSALEDAAAVVFGTWSYGRHALDQAGSSLQLILEVAGSHRHPDLDYETCFGRGIEVGSCAPAFGPAVAEMALALTLSAARLVSEGDSAFRKAEERWLHEGAAGATTLYSKTVGFVGAGGISVHLQPLLEPFGVRFLAYDPWLDPSALAARSIEAVDLPTLFAESDVVYVLAVPTPANRAIVSRRLMAMLDPTDILVVMSRAHLVDFEALTDFVLAERFRLAIDVFPSEPFDPNHRIRSAPGAVFSAHRAGAIPEALHEIGRMVADDLAAGLAGGRPSRMQYATPQLIAQLNR